MEPGLLVNARIGGGGGTGLLSLDGARGPRLHCLREENPHEDTIRHGISARVSEPHDHGKLRYITLARVESEDGAVGWGECISQFPESAVATKIIIENGYAPLLIGESAFEVERLWHKMLGRVWWYGPQGIAAFGISAVDMALWDLKGHLLNQPVASLLGGRIA